MYGLRGQCRIGAKLAQPGAVYNFVGDGSFMEMLHSELVTSRSDGEKITVILLGDNAVTKTSIICKMEHSERLLQNISISRRAVVQEGGFIPVFPLASLKDMAQKLSRRIEQLHEALEDVNRYVSTLEVDIKCFEAMIAHKVPELWWRVGGAQVSVAGSIRR